MNNMRLNEQLARVLARQEIEWDGDVKLTVDLDVYWANMPAERRAWYQERAGEMIQVMCDDAMCSLRVWQSVWLDHLKADEPIPPS